MKHQYQFDTDKQRDNRAFWAAVRHTIKAVVVIILFVMLLLLIGVCGLHGEAIDKKVEQWQSYHIGS